ncbi:23S rRNA pseudouridine synthase D [Thiomicrospira aerophila AL3]|uniref:Pseudouridine synthase n=1 Tax=Thiomicrospira aerophila AL3 TaxID=717772 RepID=W0DWU0_9GAMM|nr:23S rRNA pseudouridine(1911/1915/1917) synthase RluD [Thiomicrospira aerophila]AHF01331.1 23S rRNA pseudouridine synthase D [Thiomicrospira aerophila AL3]
MTSESESPLSFRVSHQDMGARLDATIAKAFTDYSRSRLQAWLKDGRVTVDGVVITKPRHTLLGGELVSVMPLEEDETQQVAQSMELDIVYEDAAILVINKTAGLVVHPGAGNPDGTLLNGLLAYAPALRQVPRAGIVHRLDKDTTGLMVVAKTLQAQHHLVDQLQRHDVERVYDAIVVGNMISGGTVNKPIGRHVTDRKKMAVRVAGGKAAVSHYRVAEKFRAHTHVKVSLETGRTHQIRVHMSHLGFPLLGDPLYGSKLRIPKQMMPEFIEILKGFKRQALHAGVLSLTHPVSGKTMKWKAAMPDDMGLLIDILRDDQVDFIANRNNAYDEIDYDYDVEVEWVTDADIPEEY